MHVSKPVGQYDLNMNLIAVHQTPAYAAKCMSSNTRSITRVLTNLRKSTHGFIWKYYV